MKCAGNVARRNIAQHQRSEVRFGKKGVASDLRVMKYKDTKRNSVQTLRTKRLRCINSPESIGSISGFAPDFLNIDLSTIPGCTLVINMLGSSAARNSNVFTIAIFEVKYAESPGVSAGGKARAPAVTPRSVASVLLAVGRKAVAAMMTDFTFVYVRGLLV